MVGGATQTQCLTLCLIGLTLSQASSGATLERQGGDPPVSIVAVLRARPAEQAPTGGGGTPSALRMVPLVPWEQYPWYPGTGTPSTPGDGTPGTLGMVPLVTG